MRGYTFFRDHDCKDESINNVWGVNTLVDLHIRAKNMSPELGQTFEAICESIYTELQAGEYSEENIWFPNPASPEDQAYAACRLTIRNLLDEWFFSHTTEDDINQIASALELADKLCGMPGAYDNRHKLELPSGAMEDAKMLRWRWKSINEPGNGCGNGG